MSLYGHATRALLMAVVLLASGCALVPNAASSLVSSSSASPAQDAKLEKRPDDGVTSEMHQAYLGQIVFSTEEISKEAPASGELGAEFFGDETIYGRAYLPHSFENHPVFIDGRADASATHNTSPTLFYRLYVDGEAVNWQVDKHDLPSAKKTLTTYQVWIRPQPEDAVTSRSWLDIVAGLAPGAHEVKLELWTEMGSYRARTPLAAGQFVLHKEAGRVPHIGRTFSDLESGLADTVLSATMLELARARAKGEGWKQSIAASKVMSADWTTVRHKLTGIAMSRNIFGWVEERWPDGRCTALALHYQQEILNDRPSGAITLLGYGKQVDIDCAEVAPPVSDPRWQARARTRPQPSGTVAAAPAPAPAPAPVPAPAPAPAPAPTPAPAAAERVALATEASPDLVANDAGVDSRTRSPKSFILGAGAAVNALEGSGLASYVQAGGRISRLDIGVGATWPLNIMGYARVDLLPGAVELGPMVSVVYLDDTGQLAVAGGLSLAVPLYRAAVELGLRVDAQASYDIDAEALALPVITSSYMRF